MMKYVSIKRSVVFMIIGLVVFAIYLYFYIGIPKLVLVLSSINSTQYALFYILALVAVLASVFFWSAAWNSILRALSVKITYRRAYIYYWVGYFSDLVIPCATICGEVTRLYLVQRETNENYGALAASAITNRIVAYTIVTIGLYSGATFLFFTTNVPEVISNVFILFLIGVTIYLAVLLYLAFARGAARNLARLYVKITKTLRPKHYRPSNEVQTAQTLESYYNGFQTFRENPRLLRKPFLFHLFSYLLGLSVYILIFYALGIPSASPIFYIIIYFIATAVQDAAASISVGSLEILLASIFVLYGLNPAISNITAILLRSASFWFPLFVGFVCVQVLGARNLINARPNLRQIVRIEKPTRAPPKQTASSATSICSAKLP